MATTVCDLYDFYKSNKSLEKIPSSFFIKNQETIYTQILPIFASDYLTFSMKKEGSLEIINQQNMLFFNQIKQHYPNLCVYTLGMRKPTLEPRFYNNSDKQRLENFTGPKQKIFFRPFDDFMPSSFHVPGNLANEIFDLVLQDHFKLPESFTGPRFDLLLDVPYFSNYLLQNESALVEEFQRQQHLEKGCLQSNSLLNSSKLTIISNAQKKPTRFNPGADFNYDFEHRQKTQLKPKYDFVTLLGERTKNYYIRIYSTRDDVLEKTPKKRMEIEIKKSAAIQLFSLIKEKNFFEINKFFIINAHACVNTIARTDYTVPLHEFNSNFLLPFINQWFQNDSVYLNRVSKQPKKESSLIHFKPSPKELMSRKLYFVNCVVFDVLNDQPNVEDRFDLYLNFFIFMFCARKLVEKWKKSSTDLKVMTSLDYWNESKLKNLDYLRDSNFEVEFEIQELLNFLNLSTSNFENYQKVIKHLRYSLKSTTSFRLHNQYFFQPLVGSLNIEFKQKRTMFIHMVLHPLIMIELSDNSIFFSFRFLKAYFMEIDSFYQTKKPDFHYELLVLIAQCIFKNQIQDLEFFLKNINSKMTCEKFYKFKNCVFNILKLAEKEFSVNFEIYCSQTNLSYYLTKEVFEYFFKTPRNKELKQTTFLLTKKQKLIRQ